MPGRRAAAALLVLVRARPDGPSPVATRRETEGQCRSVRDGRPGQAAAPGRRPGDRFPGLPNGALTIGPPRGPSL
jgi:hypothetical protein